jgi:hypothetical protein
MEVPRCKTLYGIIALPLVAAGLTEILVQLALRTVPNWNFDVKCAISKAP